MQLTTPKVSRVVEQMGFSKSITSTYKTNANVQLMPCTDIPPSGSITSR